MSAITIDRRSTIASLGELNRAIEGAFGVGRYADLTSSLSSVDKENIQSSVKEKKEVLITTASLTIRQFSRNRTVKEFTEKNYKEKIENLDKMARFVEDNSRLIGVLQEIRNLAPKVFEEALTYGTKKSGSSEFANATRLLMDIRLESRSSFGRFIPTEHREDPFAGCSRYIGDDQL